MFRALPSRLGYTLAREIRLEGIAVMSGQISSVKLLPLSTHSGFQMRLGPEAAWFKIDEASVVDTSGRTTTVQVDQQRVVLVEHLLSALKGMGIDHVGIEVQAGELPIFDGSSLMLSKAIAKAGRRLTDQVVAIWELMEPIAFETEGILYTLSPQEKLGEGKADCSWHCVVDYPTSALIGLQKCDFDPRTQAYLEEISPARTFCLVQELEGLRSRGLIKGGSLNTALVFDGDRVLNPEGQRFINEPARHKILDMIGDLALLGVDLAVHISAVKPGHRANNALAKIIRSQLV